MGILTAVEPSERDAHPQNAAILRQLKKAGEPGLRKRANSSGKGDRP
jgi:hypothetical protein